MRSAASRERDRLYQRSRRAARRSARGESHRARMADGEPSAQYIAEQIAKCAAELKMEPEDLVWHDFRGWAEVAWGKNTRGFTPKEITRCGGFNAIRDAYFPPAATKIIQERARLQEHARLNRRLASEAVRQKYMMEELEKYSKRIAIPLPPLPHPPAAKKVERAHVILLSDLHLGSDTEASKTGFLDYKAIQEARRLAHVTRSVCNYKLDHRASSRLFVLLGGDLIKGQLHGHEDSAVMTEQVARAKYLLRQVLGHFARSYSRVDVVCTTGNHGRMVSRHQKRAMEDKCKDSWERLIYLWLRDTFDQNPHVGFHIPLTVEATMDILGHRGMLTHGDTFLGTGNPQSMRPAKVELTLHRHAAMSYGHYDWVTQGHYHTGSWTMLDNGTHLFTNGALCPPDEASIGAGYGSVRQGQWLFEMTKAHPVGDMRFITVDRKTDEDASLDKVIVPWNGRES